MCLVDIMAILTNLLFGCVVTKAVWPIAAQYIGANNIEHPILINIGHGSKLGCPMATISIPWVWWGESWITSQLGSTRLVLARLDNNGSLP